MNRRGIRAIIDFLGEDVTSADKATAAAAEYMQLLRRIQDQKVESAISVKVSQMGLLVSLDLCLENLVRVLQTASETGSFVWLDMEGSALTQKTIDVFNALRGRYPNLGLCLQAYLVRTGGDLDKLMHKPLHVRLCKGAYKEPPDIAFSTKRAVDGNFRMLVQKALDRAGQDVMAAFATHDRFLIDYILALVRERRADKKAFEFQMLYGIQNHRLAALAQEGYQTSVYIPYGTHWLPYFLRRLRERRENVFFLLKNLLQK